MSYGEKDARRRANLAKLPPLAYGEHPETGQTIALKRGESGYYAVAGAKTAAQLNAGLGITSAQASAMLNGSMFGWHAPAADPEHRSNQTFVVGL